MKNSGFDVITNGKEIINDVPPNKIWGWGYDILFKKLSKYWM